MKYAVSRITLDLQDTSSPITLSAKQGDSMREIICGFRDDSGQYKLDPGFSVVFTAQKPSGNLIYNECSVDGNYARYQFTAQTVSEIGPLKCEFKIYDDLSKPPKLTSPRFMINVEKPVFNDGDIPESSYEFLAVQDIVKKTTVEYLETHPTITDATLTKADFAADAKAVGDAINNVLPKSGGQMTGAIDMGGNRVTGLGAPEDLSDAATKAYADGKTQFFSVTLSAQGWAEQRQSVAAPGVTAGNATHVFAAPAAESWEGYAAYLDCGVYCAEKGSGTLTFICDSVPDMDLTVHIALFADGGSFATSPGEPEQLPDAEEEAF